MGACAVILEGAVGRGGSAANPKPEHELRSGRSRLPEVKCGGRESGLGRGLCRTEQDHGRERSAKPGRFKERKAKEEKVATMRGSHGGASGHWDVKQDEDGGEVFGSLAWKPWAVLPTAIPGLTDLTAVKVARGRQTQWAGNQEALLQGCDAIGGGTLVGWRPRQGQLIPDQPTGCLGRQDER